MCLIAFAWKVHPEIPLVMAANRDEFHARAAAPAAFWPDAPDVFGGRDLSQKGSWLAVSTRGRLAAVTNVRRMILPNPQAPSRGALVAHFVRGKDTAMVYARGLGARAMDYSGFNLLLHDGDDLRYADNHPKFEQQAVAPGVHALSNAELDTPWPKALRLKAALEKWRPADGVNAMFDALADRTPAAPNELPNTGVGPQWERLLSAPFIVNEGYGTRCSTVVLFRKGAIEFIERRFDPDGKLNGETRENLLRVY